ncbi:hypothetical protein V6N12_047940 [Hibiscus sabdariffa]|uniref:Uncharacterized protein n=1 Tax=Hibiscus sabdariffa TaxID=183260 RepID=A0ABR2CUF3_9ROSI
MAKITLSIVLISIVMIYSVQFVVSDGEPSSAPIADVVAVAGPVSGNGPSSAPIADVVAVAGPVSAGAPSSAPTPAPAPQ